MYHIFAAQRHRQDGAPFGKNQAPRGSPPPTRQAWSSLRLPSSPASAAWISRWTLPGAAAVSTRSAPLISVPPRASRPSRSSAGLAQRRFDPLAEVGGDVDVAGLEGAGERALELALGLGLVERLRGRRRSRRRGPGRGRGRRARPGRRGRARAGSAPPAAPSAARGCRCAPERARLADHWSLFRNRVLLGCGRVLGRPASSSNQWARAAMMISLPCSSVRP